jgi:hypothetical protein
VIDKKRRYDRQLRIWGEAGQARLESAHVCLLTCGPTGTEALKNLVLGGIAAFTLVDGAKVTPADLGNKYVLRAQLCACQHNKCVLSLRPTPSFLVDASALGTSRAACVASLLKELNDSVSGSFVEEEPAQLVASNPAFFKAFTLVIATQARDEVHCVCARSTPRADSVTVARLCAAPRGHSVSDGRDLSRAQRAPALGTLIRPRRLLAYKCRGALSSLV